MLDKNKDIAEKGWQQMSELLDVEMPVKSERKRRVLPWLWMSGAAIGFLLLGFALFMRSPATKSEIQPPKAVAAIAANTSSDKVENAEKCSTNEFSTPVSNQTPISAGSSLILAEKNSLVPKETTPLIPSPQSEETEAVAPEELNLPALVKPAEPIVTKYPRQQLLPEPSIQLQTKPVQSGKWRWGWEGAFGRNIQAGWNAAATGPIAERQFKKRWKFRAGLQIASENYPITGNSMGVEMFGAGNTGTSSLHPGEEDINIVAQSVEQGFLWTFQTDGMQLPLTLERRMGSRWSVETGLTPVYWWRIRNAFGQVFLDPATTPITPATFTGAELDRSVTASTNSLDVRISAGLRYYLTPKWSVATHYQASMVDIQNTPTVEARQKVLRVSAIRHF